MTVRLERAEVADLVRRAQQSDAQAWEMLTRGLGDLVWSVVRGFRLSDADSSDAAQMTWLRAVERLDSVRDPERFGLWLATTARRECMRCIERGSRVQAVDPQLDRLDTATDDFSTSIMDRDEGERALAALASLGDSCQQLLRMVLCDPPFTYAEISEVLDIAVGTIGPRRQRCMSSLRAAMHD